VRRFLLAAALAAAMVVASAGAVFAGEVKGPPGSDPENYTAARTHANSICAYSGLNDYPDGSQSGPPGQVQSWGQDVKSGLYSPHDFTPGDACGPGTNPNHP
jgi:hypothetical protein